MLSLACKYDALHTRSNNNEDDFDTLARLTSWDQRLLRRLKFISVKVTCVYVMIE